MLKTILLVAILITSCNYCNAQIDDDLDFKLDSSSAYNRSTTESDYYNNEILRNRTFYNDDWKSVHFEFIRLERFKYYCIEYDPKGAYINEGVARKELTAYDAIRIPIFDSAGNEIDVKKIPLFKLYKDEFWKENIYRDSANDWNYQYGKYHDDKRDSTWEVVKGGNVEKIILYKNGNTLKEEKVNLTGSGDEKIKNVLIQRWTQVTMTTIPIRFLPDPNHDEKFTYLEINKDGSFVWHMQFNTDPFKGKWELNKNKTEITFTSGSYKSVYSIDYISRYGLNLSEKF